MKLSRFLVPLQLHLRLMLCSMAFLSALTALLLIQGCNSPSPQKLEFQSEYQAVFLDNGQVFFGKVENAGSPYPVLRHVYYVQSQVNKETKQVTNILVKRGKEWHGPDMMYINAEHIAVIEPVAPDSKVAQLIKEAGAKKQGD